MAENYEYLWNTYRLLTKLIQRGDQYCLTVSGCFIIFYSL